MTGDADYRLVICGLDGLAAEPISYAELEGVHRAMAYYRYDDLIPRLLATIEALRAAGYPRDEHLVPCPPVRRKGALSREDDGGR